MSVKVPSDFTIYRDTETSKNLLDLLPKPDENGSSTMLQQAAKPPARSLGTLSDSVYFSIRSDFGLTVYPARALMCSCWAQKALSITLRVEKEKAWKTKDESTLTLADGKTKIVNYLGEISPQEIINAPSAAPAHPEAKDPPAERNTFLFQKPQIARALFPAIFHSIKEEALTKTPDSNKKIMNQGLVVISGQTGSLKSQLLRSLATLYLASFDTKAWGKKNRLPHVLTIEDPIESPLINEQIFRQQMATASTREIDLTPRELGKDLETLEDGLWHALRQTPALVIVGEVRKEEEWKTILRFAATGHLCFTTTHAGSLVETMRKIVEATNAITPDLRSSLVEKILAVIHLKKFPLELEKFPQFDSMILPALWRNAHGSANFFVSDGLGAILPRRRATQENRPASSCRGRADFAEVLLDLAAQKDQELCKLIKRAALKSDLEGV